MNNDILLSPDALAKRQRLVALRSELAELFERRDHMVSQEQSHLTAMYIDLIGRLQYEEFALRVTVMRLKRKYQLVQSAINRGERPDMEMVERIVEAEFVEYQQQIEAQAENIKAAKSFLDSFVTRMPMRTGPVVDARSIMRRWSSMPCWISTIVRCSHPRNWISAFRISTGMAAIAVVSWKSRMRKCSNLSGYNTLTLYSPILRPPTISSPRSNPKK